MRLIFIYISLSVSERVVAKRKERGKFCFFLCQPAIKRSSVVYLKFARRRLIGRRSRRRRRTNNNGNSVERASRHATGREGKFVNAFNHLKQEDLEKCDRLTWHSLLLLQTLFLFPPQLHFHSCAYPLVRRLDVFSLFVSTSGAHWDFSLINFQFRNSPPSFTPLHLLFPFLLFFFFVSKLATATTKND